MDNYPVVGRRPGAHPDRNRFPTATRTASHAPVPVEIVCVAVQLADGCEFTIDMNDNAKTPPH
jgi:hypothetical protein